MENAAYLNRYIDALEKEGKKPGTIKQYASDLKQFISWLDASAEIDLFHIEVVHLTNYTEYLKAKKFSDTTIKRHLSSLNRFLVFYDIQTVISPEHAKTYRAAPLKSNDFISHNEMNQLLQSMRQPIHSVARDALINRNLAIVHLIRDRGLRPREIASINMHMVNLAQSTISFELNGQQTTYRLSEGHIQNIRDYFMSIDRVKRPKWHSNEPLFVSFNNRSNDYQYNYANGEPKRLSARGIQEIIKDEVKLAGLRKLSAKHLRNSCILDHLLSHNSEEETLRYFHLTHPFSLRRYKQYANLTDSNINH